MSLFNKTGFTIHPEKSVLEPVQKIAFLGFLIDSIKMSVTLTPEKASELAKLFVNVKLLFEYLYAS